MKVWVLVKNSRITGYQPDRFVEEAEKMGVDLTFVSNKDFCLETGEVRSGGVMFRGKEVECPDVVISRVSGIDYFGLNLLRRFELMGVKVVNSSESIVIADDKFLSCDVLAVKGVAVPRTVLLRTLEDLDLAIEELGLPVVLKRIYGAKGDNVFMVENKDDLLALLYKKQRSGEDLGQFILQENVKSSFGKDVRVFVVGDKVVGCMKRCGPEGEFRSNLAVGGVAEEFVLTDEIRELALGAVRAIGLEIGGVDLLFGEDGFLVGEVNASPSFEGFEKATGLNVAGEILKQFCL